MATATRSASPRAAPAASLVNADQEAALPALAPGCRARPSPTALARVKDAWLALEVNVSPRLALETAHCSCWRRRPLGSRGDA